jgi:hypothetical protein
MGASLHVDKIDSLTLSAMVGALTVVWMIAVAGLSLTIKREYLRTFWSTQTGCAFSQSHFLDNEGDEFKRFMVFYHNTRLWQPIRDRVKQWVRNMYATWQAINPAWFTDARKALIPDHFMPTEALQQENARAPDGRRLTVDDMGMLRRVSLAFAADTSESDHAAAEIAVRKLQSRTGGREGDGAAQPDRVEPLASASAMTSTTSPLDAAGLAAAGDGAVLDIESDIES